MPAGRSELALVPFQTVPSPNTVNPDKAGGKAPIERGSISAIAAVSGSGAR